MRQYYAELYSFESNEFPSFRIDSAKFFSRMQDFQMKARSLEWRKNCFSRETFDLPHQRVLNFGVGAWMVVGCSNAFTNSTPVSGCRKVREFERKRKRMAERRGCDGGKREEERREELTTTVGVAIWFCNLDKESFLPRYWLLRVRTSSLFKLGRISRCAMEQPWG